MRLRNVYFLSLIALTAMLQRAAAQPGPIAVQASRVYTGTGDTIDNAVVVFQNGVITKVGPRSSTEVPTDARVYKTNVVMPGLIDTHVHYSQTGWVDGRPDASDQRDRYPYWKTIADCEAHPERFHRAFLRCGVTAVFDVGGYPFSRRLNDTAEHSPYAPHVRATGALLTTWLPEILTLPDRSQFVLMKDEENTRDAVRSHKAAGSDAIKIWFIVRRPEELARLEPLVRAAADEATALGLPVVVHATGLREARIAVDAGAELLVHSVEDQAIDDAFVEAMLAKGTSYCPTLTVRAGYDAVYAGAVPEEIEKQLRLVHPTVRERVMATNTLGKAAWLDNPRRRDLVAANRERQRGIMAQNLTRLSKAGVPIVMGTDAGNPLTLHGPSVYTEMEAMQKAGLSSGQVIVASTSAAARAIGRGEDLGQVSVGYTADLLFLDEDPADDIVYVRALSRVCRAGTVLRRIDISDR